MRLEFKCLEAEDIPRLLPFFALRSNNTCDSTIFDSYLWRKFYEVEYVIVNDDILLMKMREDGIPFGALPICDDAHLMEGFRLLEDYFHEELHACYRIYDADESGLRVLQLDPECYDVIEHEEYADYIYSAESLRTLAGRKYHKKKNNVNAFLKNYEGRWEYRRLGADARDEIWDFLGCWEANKEENGEENVEEHLEAEMQGLHDYLNHMDVFDAVMAGIYVDGRLEAFTIGSYNPVDRMSIVHVEKANGTIRGLYTLINQEFQRREFPDALIVNREDDVGLPSLRRAKESYHPIMMGRKFEICERGWKE